MIKDYMNWCGEMEMHKIGELDMAQFDMLKKCYDHVAPLCLLLSGVKLYGQVCHAERSAYKVTLEQ